MLADLFCVGLGGVVGPHHIGDHLIADHHIPVTGRSLPAADGGESLVTKELCVHRFTREVGIAIHHHDVVALSKNLAVEDRLHV